jgi:hypothetical protein
MQSKSFNTISFSFPIVISIISFSSSVAFMSGKYFQRIEHNSDSATEMQQSLKAISIENKKLWEYILTNNPKPPSLIVKEVHSKK